MSCGLKRNPLLWLGLGLAAGVLAAGLLPNTPLHAVATDRYESFAIATGPLDEEVEAIFFLDFLTGDLKAAALSAQTGMFNAFYTHNVNEDLKVDPGKNPHYAMVTGTAGFTRRGGPMASPSKAVIYVAEITTGNVAAYSLPWSPAYHRSPQPFRGKLKLMDMKNFRGGGKKAAAP